MTTNLHIICIFKMSKLLSHNILNVLLHISNNLLLFHFWWGIYFCFFIKRDKNDVTKYDLIGYLRYVRQCWLRPADYITNVMVLICTFRGPLIQYRHVAKYVLFSFFTSFKLKSDFQKHFSKKIYKTRETWRFDDIMLSLSN